MSGFGLGSAAYINNYGRARLGPNTKLSVTGPGRAGKSRPDPTSSSYASMESMEKYAISFYISPGLEKFFSRLKYIFSGLDAVVMTDFTLAENSRSTS